MEELYISLSDFDCFVRVIHIIGTFQRKIPNADNIVHFRTSNVLNGYNY